MLSHTWLRCASLRLFVAAALLAGVTLTSSAGQAGGKDEKKPEEKKEAKKEEPGKKIVPAFPDIEEIIKKLPAELPKAQVDQIRRILEQGKIIAGAKKRADDLRKRPLPNAPARFSTPGQNRLGVRLEKPSDPLIAQLGLAAGKGQVLAEVRDNSAAAKAGLKALDILIELNGKDVSSNQAEFIKALNAIKTGEAVDAVVLRKGKRETIKGITLPDAPAAGRNLPMQRRVEINRQPLPRKPRS